MLGVKEDGGVYKGKGEGEFHPKDYAKSHFGREAEGEERDAEEKDVIYNKAVPPHIL